MSQILFKLISVLFSRFYFSRTDYAEPIYHFLNRIGWSGIAREGWSHLTFLLATEKNYVLPRLVRFEVSNLCNLKCPMCPQPEKMTRPKINMEFDLYKTVIDLNPQIKEVELFNWGEPLMNPDLVKFVKYASKKDIITIFVTNATLLNKDRSTQLVRAGLNEIRFSLDNINEEYERIRKYSFARVMENITEFIKVAKHNNRNIRTGVNIVESQYNNIGINHAKQMLKELGFDSVLADKSQFENQETRRASRCFEPYRNMTILSNGIVVPCCVDYDGVLVMGSVWDDPDLKNIFNNSAYKKLRRSFLSEKSMHRICAQCTYRSIVIGI